MKPPHLIHPNLPLPPTRQDDPRVGHLLGQDLKPGDLPRVAIIGFPSDEGVRRNAGRPGAAAAPTEIRRHLYRLTPDARATEPFSALLRKTRDLGDLPVTGQLERDQEALGGVLAPLLSAGTFVVVLGGGHETGYGHFLGYVGTDHPVRVVNIDAHPDVRPTIGDQGHSGSPFRQTLEHPSRMCRGYQVLGLLPQSVSSAHVDYMGSAGATWTWRDELTPESWPKAFAGDPSVMVTFDIDAVDTGQAPGVSAPAIGGLSSTEWLTAARAAGASSAVTSVDVCETNPSFDLDGRTARLAAMTIWTVLQGLASRSAAGSQPAEPHQR